MIFNSIIFFHGQWQLAKTTAACQSPMTLLRSLSSQIAPLMQQSLRAESEAQILKNGLKIACVVIDLCKRDCYLAFTECKSCQRYTCLFHGMSNAYIFSFPEILVSSVAC